MDVCRLRDTPIVSFNQQAWTADVRAPIGTARRDSEAVRRSSRRPSPWPIGCYRDFKGVYHLADELHNTLTPLATAMSGPR